MKKKRRLFWQLFPSYLLITFISLVAISMFASNSLRHFYLERTTADLEARADILKQQVTDYLSPLDTISIDRICKEIGRLLHTRLTVILPSGKVAGDSEQNPAKMDNHADRPEIIQAFDGLVGKAIRYSSTLQQNMMYVAVPLRRNNKIITILRTSIPLAYIDNELKSIQIKILLGGVLIALLAAATSLYVSRRISNPIEEMKKGAEQFANGDLTHRLRVPNSDEMGSLAEAMNQMASQLNTRINTIVHQHNEHEAILSSMVEGVIAVDRDERIINVNQNAAQVFGSIPSDMLGRSVKEVINDSQMLHFLNKALSSAEPAEKDVTLGNNDERILHTRSTFLCDAKDARIGTLVVLNDVTLLRRLEKMRSDFVENVSHEIRTPLTAIKGFVETLRHGALDKPKKAERFLGIIEKHVNRLVAIIEDLLNLSKIEKEDELKTIALEKGRIKDVIHTAMQVCQTKAQAKNVMIDLICEEEISAGIDPLLLEQAVVNLLDNAIKYSKKKSTVQIEVLQKDKEVIIRFCDHGSGIAQKHLPRLFERFYRVDKARSRKLGGTGLGLAIVKHIVQAHGGRVTVESTLGEGSVFSIHIPKD